jgi:hypothetical protein
VTGRPGRSGRALEWIGSLSVCASAGELVDHRVRVVAYAVEEDGVAAVLEASSNDVQAAGRGGATVLNDFTGAVEDRSASAIAAPIRIRSTTMTESAASH